MKKLLSFFLLGIILLLSMPSLIPSTSATGLSMQYGALNTAEGFFNSAEYYQEIGISFLIYQYYDTWGWDCPPVYCYWDYTNADTLAYYLDLQSTGYYASWVSNWWVGDYHATYFWPYPAPYGHLWCYGMPNGVQDISDNLVYTHTTQGSTQTSYENFVFMWTCSNGGKYWTAPGVWDAINGITYSTITGDTPPTFNPVNTNTMYGFIDDQSPYTEVGMPFAWTGRTDLSQYGYSSPDYSGYCYIGFEGPSPFMINLLPSPNPNSYQAWVFANKFYYNALISGLNIHQALDAASQYCYGVNFDLSPLYQGWWNKPDIPNQDPDYWWYSRMRVFGNAGIYPA
jgi:hypothetical protein